MAVITLIQGANTFVAEKFANLGTNVFRIAKTPFATTDFEEMFRARRHPDLGMDDLRALQESCALCEISAVRGKLRQRTVSLYRSMSYGLFCPGTI